MKSATDHIPFVKTWNPFVMVSKIMKINVTQVAYGCSAATNGRSPSWLWYRRAARKRRYVMETMIQAMNPEIVERFCNQANTVAPADDIVRNDSRPNDQVAKTAI